MTFARGTCSGASLVCIAVCVVTDDSPIRDKTSLAADGVCSIGILMCVLFENVFTALEELWEGFETAKGLPWWALYNFFGEKNKDVVDLYM